MTKAEKNYAQVENSLVNDLINMYMGNLLL